MDDNIARGFYNLCPGKQKNVKSKSKKKFTPQELGTMTVKNHQNPLYAAQNLSFRLIAVKLTVSNKMKESHPTINLLTSCNSSYGSRTNLVSVRISFSLDSIFLH